MLRTIIGALALACSSAAAWGSGAKKGLVVYDKGCGSRMIIETPMGYVLAEWYGGSTPYKGDTVIGELESYGFKDVYILNRDTSARLWIDDYMLSRSRVVEKLADKCS